MAILKYRMSIFSGDPDRLAEFYIYILGLKLIHKIDKVNDYGYSLEASPGYKIWIARHSKVSGKSKEGYRIILTLYIDNLLEIYDKIISFDEKLVIEKPTEYCQDIPGEERTVCSFSDPDGNCVQLMQLKNN